MDDFEYDNPAAASGDPLADLADAASQREEGQEATEQAPESEPVEEETGGSTSQLAKQLAANSIAPGCLHWSVKQWTPANERPAIKHLTTAMANRQLAEGEKPPQPAGWKAQKIADWLHVHSLNVTATAQTAQNGDASDSQQSQQSPPSSQDQAKKAEKAPPPPTSDRWSARSHGARLLTLLGQDDDLRQGFLIKDQKFNSRAEKDIGDRDWYYVDVAQAFNNPLKVPPLYPVKSSILAHTLQEKGYTTAHSGYILTPDVAKKKITEYVSGVRTSMAKFQQSGQGDCPSDEKLQERLANNSGDKGCSVENSIKVYSSDFQNFTGGEPMYAYAYEIFLHYGLLGHASGQLPPTASASSSKSYETAGPACRKGGATSSGRSAKKEVQIAGAIRQLANAEFCLRKSADEEEQQRLQTLATKMSLKRQVHADQEVLEEKIDQLEEKVSRAKANGDTPPNHAKAVARWRAQVARCETEIEKLSAMVLSPPPPARTARRASINSMLPSDDEDDEACSCEDDEQGHCSEDES
jgi:hypothetical protein